MTWIVATSAIVCVTLVVIAVLLFVYFYAKGKRDRRLVIGSLLAVSAESAEPCSVHANDTCNLFLMRILYGVSTVMMPWLFHQLHLGSSTAGVYKLVR